MAAKVAHQLAVRVAFTIGFAKRMRLPRAVKAHLDRILRDLGEWLDVLPEDSAYMKAIDGEVTEINVEGWRISFRVDRHPRGIFVTGADRRIEAA